MMTFTKRNEYDALQSELKAIEKTFDLYLADENVDDENTDQSLEGEEYWDAMLASAKMAAGMRAEEAGHDINKLLGKVIY